MASYFDQVNSLSPRVWYRFNETSGTPTNSGGLSTTFDSWSALLNEQTDVDGRAVYFDGSTAFFKLNTWPAFSLFDDKSFTIETWFKLQTQDANDRALFHFGTGSSYIRAQSLGTANANSGKIHFNIVGIGEQVADRSTFTTNTYFDSKWHHLVIALNTTSAKFYIDGSLIATKTLSTGSLNWDNYSVSPNNWRIIGSGISATTGNLNTARYRGWLDEFAIYGYELSAQQVLDNFNAGASVNFPAEVIGTASALAVQPATIIDFIPNDIVPMTADASFPLPNQTSYPQMLDAKMATYDLEGWIKFDSNRFNYGDGGTIRGLQVAGSAQLGLPGPCGMFAGKSLSSVGEGYIILDDPDNNIIGKITDKSFSAGIWFKIPSTAGTSNKRLLHMAGANTTARIEIFIDTNGYIQFQYRTSAGTNNYTGSTNLKDDTWHYAAMRVNNSDVRYYLDGVEVSALTVTGTKSSAFLLQFGNIGSDGFSDTSPYYVANFYVAGHTEIDATDIDEIWDVGNQTIPVQAYTEIPPSTVRFNNAYNFKVEDLEPQIDLRYDNATGNSPNFGLAGNLNYGEFNFNLGDFQGTRLSPTKNRYAYYIDDADDVINISGPFDGSDDTNTYNLYARFNTLTTGEQWYAQIGNSYDPGTFGGYVIGADSDGPFFMAFEDYTDNTSWVTFHTNDTTLFNSYHLYTIVRDGSTAKFYIDGKLFDDYTPSGPDNINEINLNAKDFANLGGFDTSATTHTYQGWYLDEFQAFDYALSAQEVFELWQSIEIDNADDVSSTFVMPAVAAGFGPTVNADEATASAELVDPASTAETNELADSLDAFAEFLHPNYGANVVIDANYGHTAATASAEFADPQFNIGDFHSADHMNASALFPDGILIIAGGLSVPPAVALDATFVMPGIVTIKGARVFAEPMRAQSLFPLPPAYIQLTDDPWFVRLYEAHADRKTEPVQAFASIGQQSTDIIKGGFLSFFDDHLADRSPTTIPNTITSELPAYFFLPVSSTGATDNTKATTAAIAPRQSNSPAPLLAIAGQDNQERKAVRVNNIEFVLPGTSKNHSERYYNVEFSIKTTKADQVLTYGQWESFQNYGSRIGVIGLSDGKIYLATDDSSPLGTSLADLRRNIPSTAPHPKNLTATNSFNYFQGRNNIADGNWHHVIIQRGWTDGRTQIWVDGQLDRQIGVLNELGGTGYAPFPGSNGTNEIRPYILGFNSNDPLLYSDFTISAWNFFPGRFLEQRDINLNYTAYGKWEPIKAEPMTASVATPQNHRAAGNRARALMLYFWPVERELGTSRSLTSTDNGQFGSFDEPTFESFLTNVDRIEYQGWDLFPVDVIGTRVSPMIKPEVWGGYGYRDQITGAPRYLDLVNDIDLTQFDAIFFRNFPEQTEELDEYVRQEFSDTYFGVKEADLYQNFLTSLRAAVDQGLSLYITNSKLALDLGIVDRVEVISDIAEPDFAPTSGYVTSLLPSEAIKENGSYKDTHRNNRFRVVNTLDGLTNEDSYIWADWMYYENKDELDFGGPNRPYARVIHRPNGLQVGDTFVNSSATLQGTSYEAVPFTSVKAGKIITAFSNTIKTGSSETDNPFRNYATCIAVEPGTILNGKATGGKIFVNFTERLQGSVSQVSGSVARGRRPIYSSRDVTGVDLNQDKWINLAFAQGQISEARKNELLADPENLDRRLEEAIADGDNQAIANINALKYWDSNGIYILASKSLLSDTTGSGDLSPNSPGRTAIVNKTKKSGDPGTSRVTTFGQWFTFEYSWQFPRLQVATVSMLTRGFRWLSDKIQDDGLVNRVQSMNVATSEFVMPVVTADKDRTVYAQPMLAGATIINAPGYALADVAITTLPLFAEAKFGDFVKNIVADTFVGTALIRQPRISGIEEDEVVVYIHHVDPILYLREDIIK